MKIEWENCPECNYPDGPGNHRYKGIYTPGQKCSGCGFTESRGMKKVNVAERVGTVLLSEGSGKDLFIAVLEVYLEGDRDDDIELDFTDVMTIGPEAIEAFVDTAMDSRQLPIELLRMRVHYSGLLLTDIDTISKAFGNRKGSADERQNNFDELMRKLKDGMKSEAKDLPLNKILESIQGTNLTTEGLEASMKQLDVLLKGFNRK